MEFAYVDVFATEAFTGNPVTVVPDADALDEHTMRAVAREFNQSETAFVLRADDPAADWRLRSFTPIGAEVFGAGHNALGAVVWLVDTGRLPEDRTVFSQQIGDERYAVTVERATSEPTSVTMRQSPPKTLGTVTDRPALAASLGIEPDALAPYGIAEVVSTGAGHLLVQLRDRTAVDRVRPDAELLTATLRTAGGEGCSVFSLDPVEPDANAHVRFFNPSMGILEDPATGTAAGPLATVLVRDGLAPADEPVVIAQGHAVGRPSRITIRVNGDTVLLSGTGLIVAEGVLRV